MQIELNGMAYLVRVHWSESGDRLVADIVDEAFSFPVVRHNVSEMADLARLIRVHTGVTPPASVLGGIQREFGELFQDAALRGADQCEVELTGGFAAAAS